jgi:hypothetical protein
MVISVEFAASPSTAKGHSHDNQGDENRELPSRNSQNNKSRPRTFQPAAAFLIHATAMTAMIMPALCVQHCTEKKLQPIFRH